MGITQPYFSLRGRRGDTCSVQRARWATNLARGPRADVATTSRHHNEPTSNANSAGDRYPELCRVPLPVQSERLMVLHFAQFDAHRTVSLDSTSFRFCVTGEVGDPGQQQSPRR